MIPLRRTGNFDDTMGASQSEEKKSSNIDSITTSLQNMVNVTSTNTNHRTNVQRIPFPTVNREQRDGHTGMKQTQI